jgi:hypothetical protein
VVKESVAEPAIHSSLSEQNEKYLIIYGLLYREKRKKFITRSERAGQAINIIDIERDIIRDGSSPEVNNRISI